MFFQSKIPHRNRGDIVSSGFTIVELLIVIVVIGILAAITIAAYATAQDSAKSSQMVSATESYIKALDSYAIDHASFPIATTSGLIACFDGTVNCNGAATQSASTALLNGLKTFNSGIPFTLPYATTLLTYSTTADTQLGGNYTGYYILFSVPISQTCPNSVAGARFLNTSTSSNVRSCRVALPTPT